MPQFRTIHTTIVPIVTLRHSLVQGPLRLSFNQFGFYPHTCLIIAIQPQFDN